MNEDFKKVRIPGYFGNPDEFVDERLLKPKEKEKYKCPLCGSLHCVGSCFK